MRRRLKLNPIRLWARARRMAAVNEASHVVIAKMLGVPVGLAYVYLTPGENLDPFNHKTWCGKTHCGYQRAKKRQRLMIGLPVQSLSFPGVERQSMGSIGSIQ